MGVLAFTDQLRGILQTSLRELTDTDEPEEAQPRQGEIAEIARRVQRL
jgi:hypothetical protein